jgi:hypothetical protein
MRMKMKKKRRILRREVPKEILTRALWMKTKYLINIRSSLI